MPSFADLINAEADAASAFVFLLREEQEALVAGNTDALTGIVERKAATAAALAPLSASRASALVRHGLAGDKAGMETWLSRNPKDQAASAAWQRLQALATEARELNRVNGELIRLRMSHNAQMLEVLLAANRQDFYGADGQTSTATPRRIIDSA